MLAGWAIDQDVGSRAVESWAGSVWDLFDWVIWRVVSNMITSTPRGIHQQQPNISPNLEQMYLMHLVNHKKRTINWQSAISGNYIYLKLIHSNRKHHANFVPSVIDFSKILFSCDVSLFQLMGLSDGNHL